MTLIQIVWEGPLGYDEAKGRNENSDYGVYQLYGHHPVYGPSCLLYIGKAYEQTFGKRLAQHEPEEWLPDRSRLEIHLGRLVGEGTPPTQDWGRYVSAAETLLIYAHSPAWNSQGVKDFNVTSVPDARVFNLGDRRSLLPELSIEYWNRSNLHCPKGLSAFSAA